MSRTLLETNCGVTGCLEPPVAAHRCAKHISYVIPAGDNKDWRAKVYASGEAVLKRQQPPKWLKTKILDRQNNLCMYCGHPFGTHVKRGMKIVSLRLNWDHFVPYAYLQKNPEHNWVAACHICNGIKGALMFDTIELATEYIGSRRRQKGYVFL